MNCSQRVTFVTRGITKAQCAPIELSCFDPLSAHPYDDSKWGHPREPINRVFVTMLDLNPQKKTQGFSLIELMIAVSVILILGAMALPRLMTTISDISLRYSASNFSGLLQTARIQAVRKNTFYSVQSVSLVPNLPIYYVDKPTAAYVNGDPILPFDPNITLHQGIGSGAPNEAAFIAGLNFTVNPTGNAPSFNARGIPCIGTAVACPTNTGQGYVVFMSKNAAMGNTPWVAVVVNPSGRVQLWSADSNGSWIQRD